MADPHVQGGLGMSWTDERVELLKKLWGDGLSATQIAAELGGITRNAVIGKVHVLGLSGRARAPATAAPGPRRPGSASRPPQPTPLETSGTISSLESMYNISA